MGVGTVGELNDVIASGKIQDLILVQESWMEQQIGNIAEQIAADPRKKIILIAGPSSSGEDDLFPPSVHSADGAGGCGRIRFPWMIFM